MAYSRDGLTMAWYARVLTISEELWILRLKKPSALFAFQVELELEFYLLDRQLHHIGEIMRKCEIILSGDSHKGTDWPLT